MRDKRKAKSCPRGLNHLSRPPESPFPQSAVRKEKETDTQSSPNLRERRLDGVQLITLLRTQ
jgi:hypothetical protein